MKEVVMGFLSKTLNMGAEQLADLLYKKSDDGTHTDEVNENALQSLLEKDAERVQALKPNTKEIFDNGFKKAEKEISEAWEKKIRAAFDVDTDGKLQGDDLLAEVKTGNATKGKKDFTPEQIKASPEYLQRERELKEALEKERNDWQQKVNDLQSTFNRQKTWDRVGGEIRQALKSLNPVLPQDQAKADRVIDMFISQFEGFEYQLDEKSGTFIPMKDGSRVENQQGYPKTLAEMVQERADAMFEFHKQPPAGNAGNQGGNGGDGGRRVNARFKDEADYLKQYAEAKTEEKAAIYEAWKAQAEQN